MQVEKDVENWIQNKVMMESGLKPFPWVLRKDVTPHLFDCQKDRKRSHTLSIRSAVEKRKRMEVLKDISNTDAGRSDVGAAALEVMYPFLKVNIDSFYTFFCSML